MIHPLISIILPVYNGETYLAKSIESCLKQTYSKIELIIVNDCSTDKTVEISKNYAKKDTRIKIVNNKTNQRLPSSLKYTKSIAHMQRARACSQIILSTDCLF